MNELLSAQGEEQTLCTNSSSASSEYILSATKTYYQSSFMNSDIAKNESFSNTLNHEQFYDLFCFFPLAFLGLNNFLNITLAM